MTSRALWGGAIALVVALVVVGGTLAGSAIASRRSAQAAEVAVATYQAAAARPGRPRPDAAATRPAATGQDLVSVPGQSGPPRPGLVGVVLDVTGNEITVKSRQGPTVRVIVQASTVIRKHGQRVPLSELRPRDRVVAVGRPNQQQRTLPASIVVVDPPRPFRAGR